MKKLRSFLEMFKLAIRTVIEVWFKWRSQQEAQDKWLKEFLPRVRSMTEEVVKMLGGDSNAKSLAGSFPDQVLLADVASRLHASLGANGLLLKLHEIAKSENPQLELLNLQTVFTLPRDAKEIGSGTWQVNYSNQAQRSA